MTIITKIILILKNGKTIKRPSSSFINHLREEETYEVVSKEVIIVEGILIFENKALRDMVDIIVLEGRYNKVALNMIIEKIRSII